MAGFVVAKRKNTSRRREVSSRRGRAVSIAIIAVDVSVPIVALLRNVGSFAHVTGSP